MKCNISVRVFMPPVDLLISSLFCLTILVSGLDSSGIDPSANSPGEERGNPSATCKVMFEISHVQPCSAMFSYVMCLTLLLNIFQERPNVPIASSTSSFTSIVPGIFLPIDILWDS